MVAALNFKRFEKGSIQGFFDLRYHGMTVKGCRLMNGKSGGGLWISFPQKQAEQDGAVKYYDQIFLAAPEAEHVRRLVIADLEAQGVVAHQGAHHGHQGVAGQGKVQRPRKVTPEGEDLSEYYTSNQPAVDSDIPF